MSNLVSANYNEQVDVTNQEVDPMEAAFKKRFESRQSSQINENIDIEIDKTDPMTQAFKERFDLRTERSQLVDEKNKDYNAESPGYLVLKAGKAVPQMLLDIPIAANEFIGKSIEFIKGKIGLKTMSDEEFQQKLDNYPPTQIKEWIEESRLGKWYEDLEKKQPEQAKKIGRLADSMTTWVALTGPLGLAYGAADYAIERALETSGNEKWVNASKIIVPALDVIKSIKTGKPSTKSLDPKKTPSGLKQRKISTTPVEELAKTKVSPEVRKTAWNQITEEAKDIVKNIENESIPLSKSTKDVNELFDKGTELIKSAEKITFDPKFKKKDIKLSGKGGLNNYIKGIKNNVTKDVAYLGPNSRELVKTANDLNKSFQSLGKNMSLRGGYKQFREINDAISREYQKIGSENFNGAKIKLLTSVNKKLGKQLKNAAPTETRFAEIFDDGNKFYKAASDLQNYNEILFPILKEDASISSLQSVFRNKNKAGDLKKIVGRERFNRLKTLSDELGNLSSRIKKMGISNDQLKGSDLALGFLSHKGLLVKKALKGINQFKSNNLFNPEYEKIAWKINNEAKKGNIKAFLGSLKSLDRKMKKDYETQQEFEKQLLED